MAEREGFEPSRQVLPAYTISNRAPSATRTPLHMAPQVGLEPTTNRLTADCSTTELLRNKIYLSTATSTNLSYIYLLVNSFGVSKFFQ
jgi:hypothetical protein